ncbi:hypothetical protein M501DRAFT_926284 [Patellaria atrata CBS 101060]|uniref:Peptidase M14 domain-containing protein n=1 Tax=Patellaria atrata CBS 101060 TaxID=1346257 RepID=A0A9P4SKH5_9PEZI|nr:hypothetical protein M501DRAFT_926284 [Patellaria atrata CBS 101060]
MKVQFLSTLFVSLAAAAAVQKRTNYGGYKVFRVAYGSDSSSVDNIVSSLSLQTWKAAAKNTGHVDVVVPPEQLEAFEEATADLETSVMHKNLGASIAQEEDFGVYIAGSANSTWFNSYHSYADHLTFLNDLKALRPSNSEIITAGTSVQGRPITGIHFWGSGGKGSKPAIVFHSTVHAREWITTMVNEYFAYTLLSGYTTDATIKSYVDKYDFYIFPVVNPDGFVYTQTNDRLWRKNRQTVSSSSCLGRDINRNWPYKWDVPGGSSTSPCAETYRGQAGGDAPETKGLSAHVNALANSAQGLKLFIDWHSYSQLFMTPYGYSCSARHPNDAELQSLARGVANAFAGPYGTRFQYGPICSTIYQATGSSVDYVADVSKGKYVFTAELRDTGTYGFVLPPSQIRPSALETWEGVKYLLANMK